MTTSWIGLLTLLSGVSVGVLTIYLIRFHSRPGAKWMLALLLNHALWCIFYAGSLLTTNVKYNYFLETLSWIPLLWFGYFFFAFTIEYTGRSNILHSKLMGLTASIPTTVTVLIFFPNYHDFLWTDIYTTTHLGHAVLGYTIQPLLYLSLMLGAVLALIGVLLLLETVFSYGPLYRQESLLVSFSIFPVFIPTTFWLFRLGPYPELNLTGISSLMYIFIGWYAFSGITLFKNNPTTKRVAERTAINDLPNPVLIVDSDDKIIQANTKAEQIFSNNTNVSSIHGVNLEDVENITEILDRENEDELLEIQTDSLIHKFKVEQTQLRDPAGTNVGKTIVFQDVTEQQQQTQRLEVFNRILRHNVRNKMSVVGGFSSEISTETSDEMIEGWADKICSNSKKLEEIASQVREFDKVRENRDELESTELNTLINTLIQQSTSKHDNVTIHNNLDPSVTANTDSELFRLAFKNLLENAIEHNTADHPQVWINNTSSDLSTIQPNCQITLRDNGPGIADSDLTAIMNDTETSTKHGSSIGLWIIKWSINAVGGNIHFDTSEEGTTVTITLPHKNK